MIDASTLGATIFQQTIEGFLNGFGGKSDAVLFLIITTAEFLVELQEWGLIFREDYLELNITT